MKITKILISAVAAFSLTSFIFAQDASEIAKKSTSLDRPAFSQSQIGVEMIDKSGKVTEKRTAMQYGCDKADSTSAVFSFLAPASVKDTRVLQVEKKNKTDDKWVYLPSLKTTRKIASAERQKSFVGTDFTYNDMTLRDAEDDSHEMLNENATRTVKGKNFNVWQIKSVPVANKNVEYAYRVQFIDKATYIPVVTEFYDKNDKLLKVLTVEEIVETTGDTGKKYNFRRTQLMENKVSGHATRVTLEKYQFDKQISERYFTQNWLNTGK